jgi:hypothetical protein
MSIITKIAHIKTTTVIWEFEFNPTLPQNQVLGSSLNAVTAIHTLAIKIQASGQHIIYFEHLHTGHPIKHIPWTVFTIKPADWECINNACNIISDVNNIQHLFSYNNQPSFWCAIPVIEALQVITFDKHLA